MEFVILINAKSTKISFYNKPLILKGFKYYLKYSKVFKYIINIIMIIQEF
jgi:hypothetical protein